MREKPKHHHIRREPFSIQYVARVYCSQKGETPVYVNGAAGQVGAYRHQMSLSVLKCRKKDFDIVMKGKVLSSSIREVYDDTIFLRDVLATSHARHIEKPPGRLHAGRLVVLHSETRAVAQNTKSRRG